MQGKKIAEGAEATIFLSNNKIIKHRPPKKYRHPELDAFLRKTRTKKEAKIMKKLEGMTPHLINTDEKETIEMEYIKGKLLKDIIDKQPSLMKEVAKAITKIHDSNIVHSDLTTSNMIIDENKEIRIIDFGLGLSTHRVEDKATDLHVLKKSLEAKHYKVHEEAWRAFIEGYGPKNKEKILKRLTEIERRGRYK